MGALGVLLAMLFEAGVFVTGLLLIVLAPVYLLLNAVRAVRSLLRRADRQVSPRDRTRGEAALREQYASGMLTLVGLEERLDELHAARRGIELEHVLDDLPPAGPRLDRAAAVCAAAGVALLFFAGPATHAAGAAAVATVFLPRRHALVYVLAVGCGLLVLAAGIVPALLLGAAAIAAAVDARRFG